jgi:hypothetical protein
MRLIHQEIARQQGLPNQTAAATWLREQGLVPHHAGGSTVQLVPIELHGAPRSGFNGIRHMGGAFELRN